MQSLEQETLKQIVGGGSDGRYLTSSPCCHTCLYFRHGIAEGNTLSEQGSFIAVAPYPYTFKAHAKGRWLGLPLLTVCVREFACALDPFHPPSSSSSSSSTLASSFALDAAEAVLFTLDRRCSLPAYVEELCAGTLWLHGREAECHAAGEHLREALLRYYRLRFRTNEVAPPLHAMNSNHAITAPNTGNPISASSEWEEVVTWLRARPSEAEIDALLESHLPARLCLTQKDVLFHRVWRREGRLFAEAPLHLFRCDVAGPRERGRGRGEALVVVGKPSGPPVHPSGVYRRNAVTSLLTEVLFGGAEAAHYAYTEYYRSPAGDYKPFSSDFYCCKNKNKEEKGSSAASFSMEAKAVVAYASIRHRVEGFELMRVWVAPPEGATAAPPSTGLRCQDWELLKRGLHKAVDGAASGNTPSFASLGDSKPPAPRPLWRPFVVHRLDAATSGVLLFALNAESARRMADRMGPKETAKAAGTKLYRALAHGHFNIAALAESGATDCAIQDDLSSLFPNTNDHKGEESAKAARWLRVERPIGCLSPHQSLYWCPGEARAVRWRARKKLYTEMLNATTTQRRQGQKMTAAALAEKHKRMRLLTTGRIPDSATEEPHGKVDWASREPSSKASQKIEAYEQSLREAITCFRAIHYDPVKDQTLVECVLLTGRTHQVRVHLASLGHPIVEDEGYASLLGKLRSAGEAASTEKKTRNDPEDREDDDVARYYRNVATEQEVEDGSPDEELEAGVKIRADESGSGPCVCPKRIRLHAWRYILPDNEEAASGDESRACTETMFESALPSWAVV